MILLVKISMPLFVTLEVYPDMTYSKRYFEKINSSQQNQLIIKHILASHSFNMTKEEAGEAPTGPQQLHHHVRALWEERSRRTMGNKLLRTEGVVYQWGREKKWFSGILF